MTLHRLTLAFLAACGLVSVAGFTALRRLEAANAALCDAGEVTSASE